MRGNVGKFEEGLNKLATYKMFGKNVEFMKCFCGMSDAGTRVLLSLGKHGRKGGRNCYGTRSSHVARDKAASGNT